MSNAPDFFKDEHLTDDLRGRSVRGAAMMFAANGGRIVVGIGSAAALGRLLDPEDFGLVAMVASVTALFDRVRSIGLGAATIQRSQINHHQISNLYWVNVLFGLLMTIAFAGSAPLIEWFFQDQRVVPITIALSLSFLISALAVQHGALLRRQMRFRSIAMIEFSSEAFGVAAAITAALLHAGYWSLVVLNLGALTARVAGTVLACRWWPALPRRGTGVRSMLLFGGQVSSSVIAQSVVDRLDRILIGKFVGSESLGYYTRAYFLLLIPIKRFHSSLRNVTVPSLSRIQDDPGRYRFFYRQAVQLTSLTLIPAVTLAMVVADPLALTVLGPKWGGSVPIIIAFAPGALITAIAPALSWVYMSLGRGKRLLRWTMFESAVTIVAIIIGLRWGAVGVAAAYSITRCALWPMSVSYCYRDTVLRWRDLLSVLWRPMSASLIAGSLVAGLSCSLLNSWTPVAHLALGAALYSVICLAAMVALPGGMRTFREMFALRRELRTIGPGSKRADGAPIQDEAGASDWVDGNGS
jgi:PST family polysaccharide transporter